MVVETGEMKVKAEERAVTRHRAANDQFLGFSTSSGPSQVTCSQSTQRAFWPAQILSLGGRKELTNSS